MAGWLLARLAWPGGVSSADYRSAFSKGAHDAGEITAAAGGHFLLRYLAAAARGTAGTIVASDRSDPAPQSKTRKQ